MFALAAAASSVAQWVQPLAAAAAVGALVPVADETQARAVAERLRAAVANETYLAEGHPVSITVSVGMTVTDLSGERFDDLLRIADRRVYRAKSKGRNQVVDSESLPA